MELELHDQSDAASKVRRYARRNYETYKEHFKSRNLKPVLTLEEFMENYSTSL